MKVKLDLFDGSWDFLGFLLITSHGFLAFNFLIRAIIEINIIWLILSLASFVIAYTVYTETKNTAKSNAITEYLKERITKAYSEIYNKEDKYEKHTD